MAYTQYGNTKSKLTPLHPGVATRINGTAVFNGHLSAARRGHPIWSWPLRWKGVANPALGPGQPGLIFIGDMCDIFIQGRRSEIIDRICGTVALSPHIGMLLTRRTKRMADYFATLDPRTARRWQPKLWLGFSAENQAWLDRRWADVRALANSGWFTFVSIAPMIGPVTLPDDFLKLGRWVIVAGERGRLRKIRAMRPAWARAVRDQCRDHGIPLFVKQMAKFKARPPDLRIRQFPRPMSFR